MSDISDDTDQGYPHWTREPEEPATYSDWTVEITLNEDATTSAPAPPARYAVHRYMLGMKSVYFNRVFADCQFVEGTRQSSRIPLPRLAMEAFEAMLDFCYSCEKKLTIDTSNAVGLFFLSDYLQIQTLQARVRRFVDSDISEHSCALYYRQANELDIQHPLLESIVLFCFNNPSALSRNSPLSAIADMDLWKAVLKSLPRSKVKSSNWSSSIASIFWHRIWGDCRQIGEDIDEMDHLAFQELTDPELLPSVTGDAALMLLRIEEFMQNGRVDKLMDNNSVDIAEQNPKMTSLQERCVKSLNRSWKHMKDLPDTLHIVSPIVLESLLMSSLKHNRALEARIAALEARIAALREYDVYAVDDDDDDVRGGDY